MTNIVFASALSFIAGICTSILLPRSVTSTYSVVLLLTFIFMLFRKRTHNYSSVIFAVVFFYAIGSIHLPYAEKKVEVLESKFSSRECSFAGRVSDITPEEDGTTRITSSFGKIKNNKHTSFGTDNIYVYISDTKAADIDVGDYIIVKGSITFPEQAMNPGDFNRSRYYRSLNVSAFCKNPGSVEVFNVKFHPLRIINSFSSFSQRQLSNRIGSSVGEFTTGILLGDRSGFSEKLTENIRLAGISHITAVSGMHVSTLTAILLMFTNVFTKRRKIKARFVIAVLLLYMILTGFSPSVVRAVILGTGTMLGVLFGRRTNSLFLTLFAASLMLALNPFLLYNPSFMLSFISATAISIFFPAVNERFKINSAFAETLIITLIANLATLPYVLWNFEYYSWIGLLSNVLIVPLVSFTFIGSLLTVVFGPLPVAGLLFGLFTKGIGTIILSTTNFVANLPFGQTDYRLRNPFILVTYYLLLYSLLLILKKRRFVKAFFTFAVVVFCTGCLKNVVAYNQFSVTYLYVGQGDCALVRVPGGGTFLIDTGDLTASDYSHALNYLQNNSCKRLNGIFISHADSDHCGALEDIIKKIPTDTIYITEIGRKNGSSDRIIKTAEEKGSEIVTLDSNDILTTGDVVFNILHPAENSDALNDNDNSMVISLEYHGRKFLFTGDIGYKWEQKLANPSPSYDVLKVSHHGSETGTSSAFLSKTNPRYAIISCGRDNIYAHPSDIVIGRLTNRRIPVYTTSKNGAITFTVSQQGNMKCIPHLLPYN